MEDIFSEWSGITVVSHGPIGINGAMTTFGDKLRKMIRRRGLSQAKLAACLGTNQPQISRWQQSDRPPQDTDRLVEMAKALNCTVDYLINDHIDEMPTPLNEDEKVVLKVARRLGYERAIDRLTLAVNESPATEGSPPDGLKESRPGSAARGGVGHDDDPPAEPKRRRPLPD